MPNENDNRYGENNRDNFNREVPPEENYYADGYDFKSSQKRNDSFSEFGFNPTDFYSNTQNEKEYDLESFSQDKPVRRAPQEANNSIGKKKKKRKGKNKPLIALTAVLSVFLVVVIVIASTAVPVLNKINYDEPKANAYVSAGALHSSSDVKNILLLGVDARANEESEESRSDSMMLVSIDKKHNCIKTTSFLRDSWVYIPVKDKKQRLNAACQYGGYQGVVDTIEYNFDVDIDGYVVTDFEMFKVMVDAIGGIEVEVTEKEAKEVTSHKKRYGHVTLEAGTHNLTGEQALAYCRIRKIDTDWKRTERQRIVIEKILKKIMSSGPVTAIKTAKSIAPYIQTDLSKNDVVKTAMSALTCISGGFEQASCPFEGTWKYKRISGADVISLDVDKNKEKLIDFIYNQEKSSSTKAE